MTAVPRGSARARVVVPALRSGAALGSDSPVALLELKHRSLLQRVLDTWAALGIHDPVVVVEERARRAFAPIERCAELLTVPDDAQRAQVLDSVLAGVDRRGTGAVVLHDAEYAFAPTDVARAVLGHPADEGAVVAAVEVTDSVKDTSRPGRLRNVDRTALRSVQHPRRLTWDALERVVVTPTSEDADEVLSAHRMGLPVHLVPGDLLAEPITNRLALWQAQISLGLDRRTRLHPHR